MLEAKMIAVRYVDGWELNANFSLASNTWTSIIGPSGSGKSTLVQAIAGFVPLQSGVIIRDGVEIQTLRPAERKISYVFQNQSLFDHLSVVQNLLLAVHDLDAPKGKKLTLVHDLMERIKLNHALLDRYPGALSGGERARVVVARALMRGHKWLILDESFAALDESLRFEIQCWIESLMMDSGLSVVSVTHQLQDARLFSHRILQVEKGRIVFDGKVLPDRHSQIENPDGSLTLLGSQDFALQLPPGGLDGDRHANWHAMHLKAPFLAQVGGQWLLRDRGKRTLLSFSQKPVDLPVTVYIHRAPAVTSG